MSFSIPGRASPSFDGERADDLDPSSPTDHWPAINAHAQAPHSAPRDVYLTGCRFGGLRCDGETLRLAPKFARGVFSNTTGPVRVRGGELHGGLATVSGAIDVQDSLICNNGMAAMSVASVRGDVCLVRTDVIGNVVCGGALKMTDAVVLGNVEAGAVRNMERVRLAGELRATRPLVLGPDTRVDGLRLEASAAVTGAGGPGGTDIEPLVVTALPGCTIGTVLPPPQGCELILVDDAQYVGKRDERLTILKRSVDESLPLESRASGIAAMERAAPAHGRAERNLRLLRLQAYVPGRDAGGLFTPALLDEALQRALSLPESPFNRRFAASTFHSAGQRLLNDLQGGDERRDDVLQHAASLPLSGRARLLAAMLVGGKGMDTLQSDSLADDLRRVAHGGADDARAVMAVLTQLGVAEGEDGVLQRQRHSPSWSGGVLLRALGLVDPALEKGPRTSGCRIS